jgi:hypothetical protein
MPVPPGGGIVQRSGCPSAWAGVSSILTGKATGSLSTISTIFLLVTQDWQDYFQAGISGHPFLPQAKLRLTQGHNWNYINHSKNIWQPMRVLP